MSITPEPARLLVIDDNKVNRLILSRSLELQGHVVETAENGADGLNKLRSQAFDLVLLDIEMPVMDGFQVLEACLKDVDLRQIPIIMTSAMDELDAVVKCVELGAEDYLTKPVNPVLLRARVSASLEKKRLRDQQRKLFRTFATSAVAEELLAKGFSLGGKYVKASAMFADIRDFTTISESQDPADTIELLNNYYALMFEAISRHDGIVNLMQGDGLMAIFGAPIHRENHREQAVLAALEMQRSLQAFNKSQTEQGKSQIRMGIGIASGKVIAGYAGTQERATYTCVGDTVNLAARLETHTKAVSQPILIDGNTQQGLSERIRIQALGDVIFKGKTQAVPVFAVLNEDMSHG
jgi:class 3 adenylate cyclase